MIIKDALIDSFSQTITGKDVNGNDVEKPIAINFAYFLRSMAALRYNLLDKLFENDEKDLTVKELIRITQRTMSLDDIAKGMDYKMFRLYIFNMRWDYFTTWLLEQDTEKYEDHSDTDNLSFLWFSYRNLMNYWTEYIYINEED